jgi:tRNA dimethylallyltransferase
MFLESGSMSSRPKLVIISGPTCVGKTGVAVSLAEPLGAEIISADAVQVYRHMNIGTAKPTAEEQRRVRHHLVDVVDPDESFSAARFKALADEAIEDLDAQGRPAFVVGGTGLYIKALVWGLFAGPGHDEETRQRLRREAETLGARALHDRLQAFDPEAAGRIHPNDTYRIIRALEVHEVTGEPISQHQKGHGFEDARYTILWIGLTLDRDILYDRINRRVDAMVAAGLEREVRRLLDQGYPSSLRSMQSIGYRHMADYLEGRVPWDEMLRLLKRDTRRFAKRQLTWFRACPQIEWLEPSETDLMLSRIHSFLK